MAKASNVSIGDKTFYSDIEIVPKFIRSYLSTEFTSNVALHIAIYKIAASATDSAITIYGEDSLTKEVWFFDTEGVSNDLSIKTNSDINARAVQPIRVISGPLTALTVTNADTVNAKYLGVIKVVVSDSTGTQLVEEEEN